MTLPTTQMVCFPPFVPKPSYTNSAPIGIPASSSAFAIAMDLIIDAQGGFTLQDALGSRPVIFLDVGVIPGFSGLNVSMVVNTGSGGGFGGGGQLQSAVWGPLLTPAGTQFHLEIDVDAAAASYTVLENGAALSYRNLAPFMPVSGSIGPVDRIVFSSLNTPQTPQCAGDVGLWLGSSTPTGPANVFMTIAPGGVATDFGTNSGGTAGPFANTVPPNLCNNCFGSGPTPPPPLPPGTCASLWTAATIPPFP